MLAWALLALLDWSLHYSSVRCRCHTRDASRACSFCCSTRWFCATTADEYGSTAPHVYIFLRAFMKYNLNSWLGVSLNPCAWYIHSRKHVCEIVVRKVSNISIGLSTHQS
ncbi:hypothetical protein K461DRAFT_139403 [Myriangium duriaei CBS 260.36]|uniref:Secreted protein n=1 Tax=Myriangium duriaei CBS 260.36 TaxID=1168546 RepID=A0A9P4MHN6_9PEZI|nr:hypothetical protein K461DRAFT_139403 [Myriangium duriaei CBS 260.36]